LFVAALAILAARCGRAPVHLGVPAPNPNGCYVKVFDGPEFRGLSDVWNGPLRVASLDTLRQRRAQGWRDAIRSLRVGATATVTLHTATDFGGESREFGPGAEHAQLGARLSARAKSIELTCR
jgi:hypothetical protein